MNRRTILGVFAAALLPSTKLWSDKTRKKKTKGKSLTIYVNGKKTYDDIGDSYCSTFVKDTLRRIKGFMEDENDAVSVTMRYSGGDKRQIASITLRAHEHE